MKNYYSEVAKGWCVIDDDTQTQIAFFSSYESAMKMTYGTLKRELKK